MIYFGSGKESYMVFVRRSTSSFYSKNSIEFLSKETVSDNQHATYLWTKITAHKVNVGKKIAQIS